MILDRIRAPAQYAQAAVCKVGLDLTRKGTPAAAAPTAGEEGGQHLSLPSPPLVPGMNWWMEMSAAGARLLKQMAFSFSSDGVNITVAIVVCKCAVLVPYASQNSR